MNPTRRKGWVIIALDLMIVLGIYFLYLNVSDPSPPRTELRGRAHYQLEYRSNGGESPRLVFSVENPADTDLRVELPRGITLQVTDGRRTVYWRKEIVAPGELRLGPAERRTWRVGVDPPGSPSGPLYADFFLDPDRQGRLELPGS